MEKSRVLVVGAGIAGVACARALQDAGVPARVVDRGRRPGGRMASRTINGRTVDLGAAYFTAETGTPFDAVVQNWVQRGLARPWTDTVAVAGPEGIQRSSTGPMRYAAAAGLRELIVDLAGGIQIEHGTAIEQVAAGEADGEQYEAVVLAMPDPQARRLLDPASAVREQLHDGSGWEPSIAIVMEWDERGWAPFHAAFVNDSPELTSLADDGDRRGDGAAVLVAHTAAELARAHLDDPARAIAPASDAVMHLLGLSDAPVRSFAHRWTFARPATQHPESYLLTDGIGLCGDAWGERSSVGTAWTSGDALGHAIAGKLS